MLVKFIALGLAPPVWKNLFHHLRANLPDQDFSAALFCSPDEIEYLRAAYFPAAWRRDAPDFLFCDAPTGSEWKPRLALLEQVQAALPSQVLVLALTALEFGVKQLIQGQAPVQVVLDNGSAFRISDPALLLRSFPSDFPRVAVQGYVSTLRLRYRRGRAEEVAPSKLPSGTVLGLSEVTSVLHLGQEQDPEDWIKGVLKAARIKGARESILGLIKESKGLYLFPGIPIHRIRGVCVGAVRFGHLLDLGQMSSQSTHFSALLGAVQHAGRLQAQRWQEQTRRLREAEGKRDLQVLCAGEQPLLNETLAALLTAKGFARCSASQELAEGELREPALLVQLAPWGAAPPAAQVEQPVLMSIQDEIAAGLAPLGGLPELKSTPYCAMPVEAAELTGEDLEAQKHQCAARADKARTAGELAQKRMLMLDQEHTILQTARTRLDRLLEADDALRVWTGTLPSVVRQALVFSHDQEEAGAVLQALSGVSKKRWFDLAPYSTPETVRNLPQDPIREYAREGVLIVTAASRDKLKELQQRVRQELTQVQRELEEVQAALERYAAENAKVQEAQFNLTRQWVRQLLGRWLEANLLRVLGLMDVVRRRHERQWLSRAIVHRVLLIASSPENEAPLVEACRQIYPAFNEELAVLPPYHYQPLDALPEEARLDLAQQSHDEDLDGQAFESRLQSALELHNQRLLQEYLDLLAGGLSDAHADLILIEHRLEVAGRILEFLRSHLPNLADAPAIIVLPELWAPAEHEALPWAHTRVVLVRRMGALSAKECAESLQTIHPA